MKGVIRKIGAVVLIFIAFSCTEAAEVLAKRQAKLQLAEVAWRPLPSEMAPGSKVFCFTKERHRALRFILACELRRRTLSPASEVESWYTEGNRVNKKFKAVIKNTTRAFTVSFPIVGGKLNIFPCEVVDEFIHHLPYGKVPGVINFLEQN